LEAGLGLPVRDAVVKNQDDAARCLRDRLVRGVLKSFDWVDAPWSFQIVEHSCWLNCLGCFCQHN